MCREKIIHSVKLTIYIGSPLRVQGKVRPPLPDAYNNRITPACAGKRKTVMSAGSKEEDHPCVCREKRIVGLLGVYLLGSPLRVQGKAPKVSL